MADGEWLLDTSILIDILRGYQPAREWVDSQALIERFISVAVAAELLSGCRNLTEQRAVERELALYQTVWIDEDTSKRSFPGSRGHNRFFGPNHTVFDEISIKALVL